MKGTERILALLLVLSAFGLYATTTGQLVGYEGESAAVTEGLVRTGALRVLPGTPLSSEGIVGRGGRRYSRTGLTQPLLEAPFYFAGQQLDQATSGARSYKWRLAVLRLYNPAMAALTVLAIFGLLRMRARSRREALGIAALCAVGSLLWPYAKIGMETTLMAMVAIALWTAAWAAARGGPGRYALAGLAAGAAAASKAYGPVLLVGVPALIWPVLALPRGERMRALGAFVAPLIAWIAAIAWYNAYRTGSLTNFNHAYVPDLLGAPLAAIGLFISPGKGLLLYSPLVVLGLLGLRVMWRADRALSVAIVLTVLANTLVVAGSAFWSDETWGPRYMLPCAWLLVAPIAWWAHGRRRRRVLGAVATLAACIQLAGVFAPYGVSIVAARGFSGVPVYPYGASASSVAYGDDGPTWIPAVSELGFHTKVLVAWAKEKLTGSGFTVTYSPFWGRAGTVDLTHPARDLGVTLPDFWWHFAGQTTALQAIAAALAALGLGSAALLWRLRPWLGLAPKQSPGRAGDGAATLP